MFKLLISDKHFQWINALLIAVSAALLCQETFILTGYLYEELNIYIIVFAGTFLAYFRTPLENRAVDFIRKILFSPFFIAAVSALAIAFFAIFSGHNFQPAFICLAAILLSTIYFEKGFIADMVSIRKIYFAKTFLLAFIWSLVTVTLPVSFADGGIFNQQVILVFIRRFFFIAALSIPFDIRDCEKDKTLRYKNFVNLIGISNSKTIAYALLILFVITILIQHLLYSFDMNFAVAMITSALMSAVLIGIYEKENKMSSLILLLTDSMLMIQFLLINAAKGFW